MPEDMVTVERLPAAIFVEIGEKDRRVGLFFWGVVEKGTGCGFGVGVGGECEEMAV